MNAWHEDARFKIFTECDVFVEDDHFLYVENQTFNYRGDYSCRECRIVEELDGSRTYLMGDYVTADNEYVKGLNVANWEIARDIISLELWHLEQYDEFEDARRCLLEYAEPGEVYTYC